MRLVLIITAFLTLGAFAAFATLSYRNPGTSGVVSVTGKPQVGGPFALTDHTGRAVTEKDFAGKHLLVYFGFTYCPDVCPTELQIMAAALEKLGAGAEKVTPLFISIDPERDTVEQMAAYVGNFHSRLVGLTGTPEQVRAAAKAYKVYFRKVEDKDSAADYTMDHSSIVYLISPDGEYLAHFAHGSQPDDVARTIAKYL